jgi:hypothetical protein
MRDYPTKMAWLLFIDESGQDHKESPYEVLAGIAVKDEHLWSLICALQEAEKAKFGRRYSKGIHELKGKKLLRRKTFSHAKLNVQVLPNEVPVLAKEILDNGTQFTSQTHLKALALAKLGYVTEAFSICENYGCKLFASIIAPNAPKGRSGGLRKDYGYLFERFFYFLEDVIPNGGVPERGILVFDELDKSKSHILIEQANEYFLHTATGRQRASLIIPEPFFVHSDLTTGIQIADLAAYCISWGFRKIPHMLEPVRHELTSYSEQISKMRHRSIRNRMQKPDFGIWSFSYISDLRTQLDMSEIDN